MMKVSLKKKFVVDDSTKESSSSVVPPVQNFDLEDFDVSDSDREDYHNNVDILFVLDTTGSMGTYIQQSMITIKKIVEKFSKMEFNIKFSLCTYRDHPPQESTYVTEFIDLTTGKQLVESLKTVSAVGGGDGPEAVMDGLREGLSKTSWRLSEDNETISKRFIFHICDAPPHGKEYGGQSADPKWQENGCPCGTKKEDINKLLKDHKVDYHLIKAVSAVDKMENLFKECFGDNYSETIVLNKNSLSQKTSYTTAKSAVSASVSMRKKEVKKLIKDDKEEEESEEKVDVLDSKEKTEVIAAEETEEGTMWTGVIGALHKKLK